MAFWREFRGSSRARRDLITFECKVEIWNERVVR
jgi:hypothetical protein